MLRLNAKKGFSIVELVICFLIVGLVIASISGFMDITYKQYEKEKVLIKAINLQNNLLQIIKSDCFFYKHFDYYFKGDYQSIRDHEKTYYLNFNEDLELVNANSSCIEVRINYSIYNDKAPYFYGAFTLTTYDCITYGPRYYNIGSPSTIYARKKI